MIRQIPECPFRLIDDTMPPRHPNGDDNDDEEKDDENGGNKEDLEPPVVREPDEGE
jgi:hypothetical protein